MIGKGLFKAKQGLLAIVLVVLASTASAAMIEGDIAFSGFHNPGDITGSPGTTAGSIDFNFLELAVGTGDFAFLAPVVSGNLFTSMPFSASGAITTIDPLFTITSLDGVVSKTVSFILQSGTVFKNINAGVETWSVTGSGIFTLDGFDNTPGDFVYTNQGNASTSFSAQAAVSEVPLPAAVWLFGSALMGLVAVRRRAVK
jgi:hypothetical protein